MPRVSFAWNPSPIGCLSKLDCRESGKRFLHTFKKIIGLLYQHFVAQNGKGRAEPIPDRILVPKLLKELSRELRHAERNSANAPGHLISVPPVVHVAPVTAKPIAVKPEKEPSKRIRRKPQRADFVDINEALSNFAAEEVDTVVLKDSLAWFYFTHKSCVYSGPFGYEE